MADLKVTTVTKWTTLLITAAGVTAINIESREAIAGAIAQFKMKRGDGFERIVLRPANAARDVRAVHFDDHGSNNKQLSRQNWLLNLFHRGQLRGTSL